MGCGTFLIFRSCSWREKGTYTKLEYLVNFWDNGYVCSNSINNNDFFYVKRKLRCDNYIESQYYNLKSGFKGKSIVTEVICAIYY